MDRSLLLLIRLEDLKELLVRLGIVGEPVLDLVDVVDGVVELDLRGGPSSRGIVLTGERSGSSGRLRLTVRRSSTGGLLTLVSGGGGRGTVVGRVGVRHGRLSTTLGGSSRGGGCVVASRCRILSSCRLGGAASSSSSSVAGEGSESGRKLTSDLRDGSRGGDDGDESTLVTLASETLDAVARRQEGVEALDERGVATEEGGDAVDNAWGIDAAGGQTRDVSSGLSK